MRRRLEYLAVMLNAFGTDFLRLQGAEVCHAPPGGVAVRLRNEGHRFVVCVVHRNGTTTERAYDELRPALHAWLGCPDEATAD